MYDWASGAFYDQEQWVTWPGAKSPKDVGWIETGITEGNYVNCCTAYPFYATENPEGNYSEFITTGPVESGSGKYNYTMIESESNGNYNVYWSGETNTDKWFLEHKYSQNRPTEIEYAEAGLEAATEDTPYHAGRQEVAFSDGGTWYPWTGAEWFNSPGVCINSNRENKAAGNIEWDPGHNECKGS